MKEDIPSKSKADGKGFVAYLYAAIVVAYWDEICGSKKEMDKCLRSIW